MHSKQTIELAKAVLRESKHPHKDPPPNMADSIKNLTILSQIYAEMHLIRDRATALQDLAISEYQGKSIERVAGLANVVIGDAMVRINQIKNELTPGK